MREVRGLSSLTKLLLRSGSRGQVLCLSTAPQQTVEGVEGEFRKLDLVKSRDMRRQPRKRWERKEPPPPRFKKMPLNQDWPSVWPTARTFHPASVPLPLHQGYVPSHKTPPGKFGNLELMKIPNFLHLTPPAIQRHCEALKQFCTPWPEELKSEASIEEHFPLEVVSSDYLHSSPTIRDIRTRIITVRLKVSNFGFDEHATDKFLRLVGKRYDIPSDLLTLMIDCCPMRKQNYDYAMYLLAALYHESWSNEPWEAEKSEEDMEKYIWEGSESQRALTDILAKVAENLKVTKPEYLEPLEGSIISVENIGVVKPVQKYRNSTTTLHNQGETTEVVEDYGKSVRTLFNLPIPT